MSREVECGWSRTKGQNDDAADDVGEEPARHLPAVPDADVYALLLDVYRGLGDHCGRERVLAPHPDPEHEARQREDRVQVITPRETRAAQRAGEGEEVGENHGSLPPEGVAGVAHD